MLIMKLYMSFLSFSLSLNWKGREDVFMNKEYQSEYKKLGVRVAYIRRQRDWTQQDVANLLNSEAAYVSRIERGTVGLSLDTLFKVARALDVPAYVLLDFRDMQG